MNISLWIGCGFSLQVDRDGTAMFYGCDHHHHLLFLVCPILKLLGIENLWRVKPEMRGDCVLKALPLAAAENIQVLQHLSMDAF